MKLKNARQKRSLTFLVSILALIIIASLLVWQFKMSVKEIQEPLDNPSNNKPGVTYDAQLHDELGVAKKAVDEADKSPKTDEEAKALTRTYVNLGMAQYNVQQFNDSVATYEKLHTDLESVSDRQLKQDILSGLMYAYAANNQREEAIKACEQLIAYLETMRSKDQFVSSRIEAYQTDLSRLKAGESL